MRNKTFECGPCIRKTDESTRLIAESSSQHVSAFPTKSQPRPLAFWLHGNEVVVESTQFFCAQVSLLRFLAIQEMKVVKALAFNATQNNGLGYGP